VQVDFLWGGLGRFGQFRDDLGGLLCNGTLVVLKLFWCNLRVVVPYSVCILISQLTAPHSIVYCGVSVNRGKHLENNLINACTTGIL